MQPQPLSMSHMSSKERWGGGGGVGPGLQGKEHDYINANINNILLPAVMYYSNNQHKRTFALGVRAVVVLIHRIFLQDWPENVLKVFLCS